MHTRAPMWLEAALAVITGFLGILTLFWPTWIEVLTGWDPDRHSGSSEILIVVGLLALSVAIGMQARHTYRRISTRNAV